MYNRRSVKWRPSDEAKWKCVLVVVELAERGKWEKRLWARKPQKYCFYLYCMDGHILVRRCKKYVHITYVSKYIYLLLIPIWMDWATLTWAFLCFPFRRTELIIICARILSSATWNWHVHHELEHALVMALCPYRTRCWVNITFSHK